MSSVALVSILLKKSSSYKNVDIPLFIVYFTMYDVYVAQLGGTTYAVRSNGRVITKVPSGTDCSRLLKAAVDATPADGHLGIQRGVYMVVARYALPLNPDGSNVFFTFVSES